MRPVGRPPWDPRWAELDAGDAAAIAFGDYCSACEIPLPLSRIGWHAGTGQVMLGRARELDWDDLLVLCRHCAQTASGQAQPSWGDVLLPDRATTFGIGNDAPFGYQPSPVEVTGTDGGEPEVVERVYVVPNSEAAANTVRLFGLNTPVLVDDRLRLALTADPEELALSGTERRKLIEFDDPRLMLRTAAWQHAKDAAEIYQEMSDDDGRLRWARLLGHAVRSRGFWSVWAAVLSATTVDRGLLAGALAVPPTAAEAGVGSSRPVFANTARAFPATRGDWLLPMPDSSEQD
ncbi:MAG TPA: hypothetical protein VJ851_14200 [Jatrophihabitans sp.]|nr:hypothetical protein [Jatrophihabitans sp.]